MGRRWSKKDEVVEMPNGTDAVLMSCRDGDYYIHILVEQGYMPERNTPPLSVVVQSFLFRNWLSGLDKGFRFKSQEILTGDGERTLITVHACRVTIQSVDMFGSRIGFIKLKADLVDDEGNAIPSVSVLRGDAAAALVVFICEGKAYVVLLHQPRAATGKHDFCEIPAGMLDGSGDFTGTAARELKEETGITIRRDELVELANCYTTPGLCDEQIGLSYVERNVDRAYLDDLQGRLTGKAEEGENIAVRIVPLDELPKWAGSDMKSMLAYYMYKMRDVQSFFDRLGDRFRRGTLNMQDAEVQP